VHGRVYLVVPFACVALFGVWTGRLTTVKKIVWSVPLFAWLLAFVP